MHSHFRDLLLEFNAFEVEYLVVGAHALAAHGHIRATKDLNIWVRPTPENARKAYRALASFGAPLHELREDDLSEPGIIFQVGVAPVRIDIITSIDGVEFADAWPDRMPAEFDGVPASVLSRHHLIQNKQASGRLQDLADVERLQRSE